MSFSLWVDGLLGSFTSIPVPSGTYVCAVYPRVQGLELFPPPARRDGYKPNGSEQTDRTHYENTERTVGSRGVMVTAVRL